ncbi:MAG: AraC family ligand binding domain-containing protein [Chloroflexi bacterium]|nr:AraC family ligand binding domain-containing protein [Chloroflexota bacterium]
MLRFRGGIGALLAESATRDYSVAGRGIDACFVALSISHILVRSARWDAQSMIALQLCIEPSSTDCSSIDMTTEGHRDRPLGETSGSEQRPARRLAATSLDFDLETELSSLKQEPSWLRGDRNGRTLVEEPAFRVTLTALKAGTRLREHRTNGWVSVQTLHGHLRIHVSQRELDLPAGHVLVLEPGVPHDVEALDTESAFLLTVAMHEA